jgi:death-on-curing protein
MSRALVLPPLDAVMDAYHREMAITGGAKGLRNEQGLLSALDRASNKLAYHDPAPDIHDLAAALAFGIARNHPFVDGNKRMAFIVSFVTLRMNGWYLDAPEQKATQTVLALAEGVADEAAYADWLRQWSYQA